MRSLDELPLESLNRMLSKKFGESWFKYEEETLSLELGVVFSNLLLQKLRLLKTLLMDASIEAPEDGDGNQLYTPRIVSDPLFFVHASDIINNQVVDPHCVAMPTSLEAAWTVYTLDRLPIDFVPSKMVTLVCEHVLKNDGFQIPVSPFEFVPETTFASHMSPDFDIVENQQKAIKAYIHIMESGENA